MTDWPITMHDVLRARQRIAPYLTPTPLMRHSLLEREIGSSIEVWVKHENHMPTGAFKARNGLAVMTALSANERRRGVVAATRGNHGLGLAWAGSLLGVPVTVCVPEGNNPEKNDAVRALGAELIEAGTTYDESVGVAERLVTERGLRMVHSTNEPLVIAGAATLSLEILEGEADVDAMVVAVGGGSQAVGAMTVARALRPDLEIWGVQAAAAPAIHDSWHAGRPLTQPPQPTMADGLATGQVYDLTFPALRTGLDGFVTVTEAELAEAIRRFHRTTHQLAEAAGAAGLAGLYALRHNLAGRRVAVILSGANIDRETLVRVMTGGE